MVFLARTSWFRLVGPVYSLDLVRTARRGTYLTVRLVYPLLVFVLMLLVFAITYRPETDSQHSSADFCVAFFAVYMAFNILALFLLTPAYAAGALAEEKKHQTLDALLASDLRDREIVLGTYLSRITKLGLIFLGPLPIFSFLQFLGGLEPILIVAGFAFTGISLCSLAAVSVFCSVRAQDPREALVRTYTLTVVLTLALTAFWSLVQSVPGWKYFPGSDTSLSPVCLEDVANWLNFGNPIVLALQLIRGIAAGSTLDKLLPIYLGGYAAVHAGIVACSLAYAVWFLRRYALGDDPDAVKSSANEGGLKHWLRTRWCDLPWIDNRPMLWKELFCDRTLRRGWLRRLFVGLGLVALLLPIIHLNYFFRGTVFPVTYFRHLELVNVWLRLLCAVFGSIALLQTLAAATGSIAGERDKQTLEELLATPLTNRAIFFAKWQGALCHSGAAWKALLCLWCIGLWTGSIHPAAIAAFSLCWISYAAFLSSLGLWFSVVCRSTRQATAAAFLSLSVIVGCTLLCAYNVADRYMPSFEATALIPIAALVCVTFTPMEWSHWLAGEVHFRPGIHLIALSFWWIGAWGLYLAARSRFGVMTGRIEGDLEATTPPHSPNTSAADWKLVPVIPSRARRFSWAGTVRLGTRAARIVFLLLPVLAILGWYETRARNAEESVRGYLANLDGADPSWREYVPTKRWNLTTVWSPILQSVQPQLDPFFDSKWLDNEYETVLRADYPDRESLPADTIRAIRDHHQSARPVIEELRELGSGKPAAKPSPDDDPVTLGEGEWWLLDRLLVTDAYQQILNARYHDALESCVAILALTQARRKNTETSFMPFGWSEQNQSVDTVMRLVARILARGELTDADLKRIQIRLEEEDRPSLKKRLRLERGRLLWLLDHHTGNHELATVPFIHEQDDWSERKYNGIPRMPGIEELMFYATFDSLDKQRCEIFEMLTDCIDGTSTAMSAPQPWGWGMLFRSQLDYYLGRMHQSALYYASIRCQLRATAVALALERYRLAHGSWPSSLDELKPTYLTSIPVGQFDGNPLSYKRVKDGVVIYAVGADRVDRGGSFTRNRWFLGRTDLGVRLWDPAKRQMQAIPEKP